MANQKLTGVGLAIGCVIAGLLMFAQTGQTQEKKLAAMEHHEMIQSCAKACSDCQRACDGCAAHCSHMLAEGKKDHAMSLATCQDCATICTAAAQIVSRGGPFSKDICTACADACSQCAKECEQFSTDKHMQACAEECRKCEAACKGMMTHVAGN